MQTKQMKHAQMKQKLGDEYLNRTKSILKIKLNKKNYETYKYLYDPSTDS
jgi:hypothetical protein